MNFLDAIILGAAEGITEFLPVSSTAHLILAAKILGLDSTALLKSFEIVIQLGAILAVVFIYKERLRSGAALWFKLAIAFVPTGFAGLFLYKHIKASLTPEASIIFMFLTGALFIAAEFFYKIRAARAQDLGAAQDPQDLRSNAVQDPSAAAKNSSAKDPQDPSAKDPSAKDPQDPHATPAQEVSLKTAVFIGLFQVVSLLPGVSRSGITIIGGMFLGLSRTASVEFSFLLALPTMFIASGYELYKNQASFSAQDLWILGAGFAASFVFSYLAVKWFLRFVRQNTFTPFGVYLIASAAAFGAFL